MNFHSTATLVALLLVSGILQGQVKDQYQDKKDGLTTVVVKEDTANDLDVLNSQFDLDEVGMHQVIRITTRQEQATPSPVEVSSSIVSIPEVAPIPRSIPEAVLTPEPPVVESPVEDPILASVEKTVMVETELKAEVVSSIAEVAVENQVTQNLTPDAVSDETVSAVSTSTSEITSSRSTSGSSSSTFSVSSGARNSQKTIKVFNKRIKKQKRKRIPNRRKRHKKCYRF